jgi:ankyrin repeat protein/beta-lactamase regulating signal transducer with metallopeptidase domain
MIREIFLRDLSLWGCLWQSTMFVALGLSAGYFLRHRPSRAYQVLLLTMIGATAVPLMSVVVKHFNLGVFTARAFEMSPMMLPEEHVAGNFEQRGEMQGFSVPSAVPPALPDSTFTEMTAAEYSIPWHAVAMYGWMTATLILLARLVVTFVYGAHIVRCAMRSACEHIQQAIDKVAFEFGFPCGLQVRNTKLVRSPVVWCWSHPSILLVPGTYMDPKIDWAGVVAHELAHRKRWDHVTGLAAELVACLLPWNPLMWLSKKYLIRLCEQACDDWVVAAGQPSEDYAESLLRFRSQRQMAFLPAVVHSRKGLAGRVDRILRDGCSNPRMGLAWALAVSLVSACLAAGVAFAQTRPAKSATAIVESQDTAIKSLHKAAADGDLEQVKKLIAQGADINAKDSQKRTALQYASEKGHAEVARLLISHGAYVNANFAGHRTPLHYAAMTGNKRTVELLLSKGADINARNEYGITPLFEAMRSSAPGRKEVVECLVSKGGKVPAFHLASYMADMEKVKQCLQDGIDINSQADFGCAPLHAGVNSGKKDVVELLIANGANVDARDAFGVTPLYYAVTHNYEDILRLLLAKGANVNAKDNYGSTLLYHAIWDHSIDAINLLISKGANVNVKEDDGYTPLIYAIWEDDRDMVELLIDKGSDVNAEDNDGLTPYYWAAMQGIKDLVELLTAKGATPESTIHLAARAGDLAKVQSFIQKGTDVNAKDRVGQTPLFSAVLADTTDVAKFLIAKGADIDAKDSLGMTPLISLLRSHDKKDMVELLISKGANVNTQTKGGATPLHLACGCGENDAAELLIVKGANVNAKATGRWVGVTPLHCAAGNGYRHIVELLLAKGANVNAKDNNGQTPLHTACSKGQKDVVELLIAKGADVNAKDNKQQTALLSAKEQGRDKIAETLCQHGAKE